MVGNAGKMARQCHAINWFSDQNWSTPWKVVALPLIDTAPCIYAGSKSRTDLPIPPKKYELMLVSSNVFKADFSGQLANIVALQLANGGEDGMKRSNVIVHGADLAATPQTWNGLAGRVTWKAPLGELQRQGVALAELCDRVWMSTRGGGEARIHRNTGRQCNQPRSCRQREFSCGVTPLGRVPPRRLARHQVASPAPGACQSRTS